MQADSYKRLTTLDCHRCGKEYQPTLKKDGSIRKRNFKACSQWCQVALSKGLPKQEYIEPTPCKHCGTMFKAKKEPYGRALFCSRECFKADAGIKNPTKRLNTEVNALHRIASRESKPFLSMIVLKEMAGLSRIHKAHYKTFYEKTLIFGYKGTKLKIFCEQCSKPFVYQMGQGGLKRKCDNCIKENKRTISRIAKGVRRAKQRLVSYQSIDPIKVFEQDKWKCHICGIYTPKELRGTHLDQAPELDHIITIADGGSHTYGNVACACRSCNQKKGAKSCGQLKFF